MTPDVPVDSKADELAASSAADASVRPFEWPTPAGWRSETIPFPLGFAPELPYHGAEELRFAPRFFDPASPTYFTYAFAFLLEPFEGRVLPFEATRFASDLRTYFTGLARAVSPTAVDPAVHGADVVNDGDGAFRGTVRTIDAFGDGRALELHLAGETFVCSGRRVILASLSPRATTDPVWTALAAQRRTFTCARGA